MPAPPCRPQSTRLSTGCASNRTPSHALDPEAAYLCPRARGSGESLRGKRPRTLTGPAWRRQPKVRSGYSARFRLRPARLPGCRSSRDAPRRLSRIAAGLTVVSTAAYGGEAATQGSPPAQRMLSSAGSPRGTDPLCHAGIVDPRCLLTSRSIDREQAHLSTEQPPAGTHARFPVADADPRWSYDPGRPPP